MQNFLNPLDVVDVIIRSEEMGVSNCVSSVQKPSTKLRLEECKLSQRQAIHQTKQFQMLLFLEAIDAVVSKADTISRLAWLLSPQLGETSSTTV